MLVVLMCYCVFSFYIRRAFVCWNHSYNIMLSSYYSINLFYKLPLWLFSKQLGKSPATNIITYAHPLRFLLCCIHDIVLWTLLAFQHAHNSIDDSLDQTSRVFHVHSQLLSGIINKLTHCCGHDVFLYAGITAAVGELTE